MFYGAIQWLLGLKNREFQHIIAFFFFPVAGFTNKTPGISRMLINHW